MISSVRVSDLGENIFWCHRMKKKWRWSRNEPTHLQLSRLMKSTPTSTFLPCPESTKSGLYTFCHLPLTESHSRSKRPNSANRRLDSSATFLYAVVSWSSSSSLPFCHFLPLFLRSTSTYSSVLSTFHKLNCGCPKIHMLEILTPSTSEYHCIWRRGL